MIYIHDSLLLPRDKVWSLHFRFLGIICSNSSRWLMSSWWCVCLTSIDPTCETLMENGTMCSICLTIKLTLNHLLSTESECINCQLTTTGRGGEQPYTSWNILKPSKSPLKIGWIPQGNFNVPTIDFQVFQLAVRFRECIFHGSQSHHDLGSEGFSSKHCRNGGCWNGDVYNRRYISYKTPVSTEPWLSEKKFCPTKHDPPDPSLFQAKKKGSMLKFRMWYGFETAVILWRDLRAPASQKKRDPWNSCSFFDVLPLEMLHFFFVTDCQLRLLQVLLFPPNSVALPIGIPKYLK